MKKTFNKALSLILARLMIGGAMTTLAFAEEKKPYMETVSNLTEENRILYLDDLDLNDGDSFTVGRNYTDKNYNVTPQNLTDTLASRASVSGEAITCNLTSNGWYFFGVETNLQLNETSEYTIEFYAKKILAHGVGFGWSNPNGNDTARQGLRTLDLSDTKTQIRQLGQKNANSSHWMTQFADGTEKEINLSYNATNTYKDSDGYVRYTITLNKGVACLYIGGELVIENTQFTVANQADYISLFCMNYTNERDAAGTTFAGGGHAISIKDISVYDTADVFITGTNAKNGDILLELDNLDLNDGNAFTSSYDIDVTKSTWSNANHDGTNSATVSGDVVTSTRTANNWYMLGLDTSLPLNSTSKYTVEYYVKELMPHAVGLVWSNPKATQAMDKQGFIMFDRGGANKGYDTEIRAFDGSWGASKLEKENGDEYNAWPGYNVTTKHKDADGYVRYTITIDGSKASLYVGGELVVENAVFDIAQAQYLHLGIHNWTAESQGEYGGVETPEHASNAATSAGEAVSVKNIKVWQGHTVRANNAVAVFLDGSTQELSYGEDNMITEFPKITEGVAENETVIWTYSKSGANNVVAVAPFEVTSDITFTAKKVKISDNTLVGMQYTAIADNKQNVRFISTIHSLKGSAVGFEITAKYLDNGVLTEQNWDKNCTYVYTAIKATTPSGTVEDITANELGGTYLFALSVDEVPTSIGQIDFYVRSYVVINGAKIYDSDNATRFSMNGGAIDYTAAPLQ